MKVDFVHNDIAPMESVSEVTDQLQTENCDDEHLVNISECDLSESLQLCDDFNSTSQNISDELSETSCAYAVSYTHLTLPTKA